jgi:sirohydrochlorin ferrochelatase
MNVVLVAHGSRDPRASVTVRAMARTVTVARPDLDVSVAFLDFDEPGLAGVLDAAAGRPTVVVPLLLTPAYHARIDIPTVVAGRPGVRVTDVISAGGTDLLVEALRRRIPATPFDGIVLAAAGSRAPRALAAVDEVAAALGDATGVPCIAGHASGAGSPVADSVAALRSAGAHRIVLASYFLAPGLLHDRAMAADPEAIPTEPLGASPEIARLITARIPALVAA